MLRSSRYVADEVAVHFAPVHALGSGHCNGGNNVGAVLFERVAHFGGEFLIRIEPVAEVGGDLHVAKRLRINNVLKARGGLTHINIDDAVDTVGLCLKGSKKSCGNVVGEIARVRARL